MVELFTMENMLALVTLTALEIVLGIDNIVFIAILSGKLPPKDRPRARNLGLLGAMVTRVLLLLTITFIMGLTKPLFTVMGTAISGKDLILLIGGMFLVGKATHEIHGKIEPPAGGESGPGGSRRHASMASVIIQIMIMDIIFSLDSVITAVGMVEQHPDQAERADWHALSIMIAAVMIAVGVMLAFSKHISEFVERHPTIKMLALSFLILIGVMLIADSFDKHIPKGYIYFAMAFSLAVEMLNIRMRGKAKHAIGD